MSDYTDKPLSLISEMREEDRPREKALKYGVKSLSDTELMAIIFATGLKGKSVLELSAEILRSKDGHLSQVARMSPREIMNAYKGIGLAKAISLLSALELGTRAARDAAAENFRCMTSSSAAVELIREKFQFLDHEEFWVMLMTNGARVLAIEKIGVGGQTATVVDIKILMRKALEHRASRMIVFHNHPSGTLQPSMQDDKLTRHIAEAAKIFEMRLDDHIIITDDAYYSYRDKGRLS